MSRILIIEDEEAIADLEKDYLELSGFEVAIEHTGDEGLKKALKEDFDLVVLDLMLPGLDGFEVFLSANTTFPDSLSIIMAAVLTATLLANALPTPKSYCVFPGTVWRKLPGKVVSMMPVILTNNF